MAGPYKMKGSPMQRNFGVGTSPLQKDKTKKVEKKPVSTDSTKEELAKKVKNSKSGSAEQAAYLNALKVKFGI